MDKSKCIADDRYGDIHRYEARYDEIVVRDDANLSLSTKRIYVCDVCLKCGNVIDRSFENKTKLHSKT